MPTFHNNTKDVTVFLFCTGKIVSVLQDTVVRNVTKASSFSPHYMEVSGELYKWPRYPPDIFF
jgi:hypothetical protein